MNNKQKNKAELFEEKLNYEPLREDVKTARFFEIAKNEAEEIADKKLPGEHMGKCHLIWSEQKRILKEKYDLDWSTPPERFPNARFD